jgi:hypothetical protein
MLSNAAISLAVNTIVNGLFLGIVSSCDRGEYAIKYVTVFMKSCTKAQGVSL